MPGQDLNLLSVFWSAKEAMYKWYGEGSVDFSEMMRTFPFQLKQQGNIDAAFMKEHFQRKLLLHYKLIEELTLVWVGSVIS